jgi:serine/threonine protein kinase
MSPLLADRFELIEALGKGSFAHTWRARDATTDHVVAVKILDARTSDWKARELFERETSVLASLRHHGIPGVVASFRATWEGAESACLAMEYVEGTSLATVIAERRRMGDHDAIAVFSDLLGILDYLHSRVPPVLHRDIKPANILLRTSGTAALVDFGSVREGFAMGASEAGSTVAGTYGYMPYEQYMGQAQPSSDLYALAATMLHLLTGKAPREFMSAEGGIEVPAEVAGGANLRGVLARMLLRSPSARFAGARDVQRALMTQNALAPVVAGALLPRGRTAPVVSLPPTPRELSGEVEAHCDRVSYSMWQLLEGDEKSNGETSLLDVASIAFFSIITVGILPMVFVGMASKRRRRTRMFFKYGTPAQAVITGISVEKPAFDVAICRLHYEFVMNGELRRDADTILPRIANRWRVGDTVQVLVIAEQGYDSIIISDD